MSKRYIIYFLFVALMADLSFSFFQHYTTPLDGDVAGGIIINEDVKKIFEDPFGIGVITKNEMYSNPNRFFVHWTFAEYFKNIPLLLQKITDPINSVYLSCAIAKILIQTMILYLLAFFISGSKNIFKIEFLIAAVIITPLFQNNGYQAYMGIIDQSITYSFFYALPCAFLLLFYKPFFQIYFQKKSPDNSLLGKIFLVVLAIALPLSGPLNPGVVLVLSLLFIFNDPRKKIKEIPPFYLTILILISLVSIYSLYIGRNNSIFIGENVGLLERYSRLPKGLYFIFSARIAWPLILLLIIANSLFIKKYFHNEEGSKLLRTLKWISLFSLLYILLLPLGGYKNYRENIIRYDTFLPVTLCLIFYFGASSVFLIKSFTGKKKTIYLSVIVLFSCIFTFTDKAKFDRNVCEKNALHQLAESKEKIVLINSNCGIIAWGKFTKPEDSRTNCKLLQYWGIIKEEKLYYQK
ncbi:MAG: hypothetical protein NT150_15080 [Bacteroidetes bacterium]|nr:hypothetical protein [Bacteroidota bacterium]